MENMVLKEPGVVPGKKVLEKALGKTYAAYEELMTAVTAKGADLTPIWRYYNDGKAWLCKVQHKKKTVFWLSVFEKYFKITFYFTEKTAKGVAQLDIDKNIKQNLSRNEAIGKLLPLSINVNKNSKLKDVLTIIEYKKSLK